MENDRAMKSTDLVPTLWGITILYEDIRTEKHTIMDFHPKTNYSRPWEIRGNHPYNQRI